MSQQGYTPSSSSPGGLPKKRKRGRPRKDENRVQEYYRPAVPAPGNERPNIQSGNNVMLGQMVSGLIEGVFDEGYLIRVKVGDTYLRGPVFLPGQVAPVTAENDVAPHLEMIKRHDIPFPLTDSQAKHHGSMLPMEQSTKQSGMHAPTSLHQGTPVQPLPAVPTALSEDQAAATKVPFNDGLLKGDAGLSLARKAIPEQIQGFRIENQSASSTSQLKHDKFGELNKLAQESEALAFKKEHNFDMVHLQKSREAEGSEFSSERSLASGFKRQSPFSMPQLKHDNVAVQEKSSIEPSQPTVESDLKGQSPFSMPQLKHDNVVVRDKQFTEPTLKSGSKSQSPPVPEQKHDSVCVHDELFLEPSLKSNFDSQSVSAVPQLKLDEVVVHGKLLQGSETSLSMEKQNINVGAKEDLPPGASETIFAPFLGKNADMESTVQNEPVDSDVKMNELFHEEVKNPDSQVNQMPECTKAKMTPSDSFSKEINNTMEKLEGPPEQNLPQDMLLMPSFGLSGRGASSSSENLSIAAQVTKADPNATHMDISPPENNLAVEESAVPEMSGNHLSDSSPKVTTVMISNEESISSVPQVAAELSTLPNTVGTAAHGLNKDVNGDN